MEAAFFKVYQDKAGFLAIMARPQLEKGQPESISTLAEAGIGCIVSLLEASESSMLGLAAEPEIVAEHDIHFVSFPIGDFGVPTSVEDCSSLVADIFQLLGKGTNVLIHCRGGVGRSGLMAAGVLLQAGLDPQQAFTRISTKRGIRVPETTQQHEWLIDNGVAIAGYTLCKTRD